MAAPSSITPQFNLSDTVFFIQTDILKQASVVQILITKNTGGTHIRYDISQGVQFDETDLYSTAQEAVDAFAQNLLDEFEES